MSSKKNIYKSVTESPVTGYVIGGGCENYSRNHFGIAFGTNDGFGCSTGNAIIYRKRNTKEACNAAKQIVEQNSIQEYSLGRRKHLMSVLYVFKNQNGIAMAADSRLIRNENEKIVIVSDRARKIFKTKEFILGVTGTADVEYENGYSCFIQETVENIIGQDMYIDHEQFLTTLEQEISYSCQAINEPDYHFVLGYTENKKYVVRNINIQKNGKHTFDMTYNPDYDCVFAVGRIDLVPQIIHGNEKWSLKDMKEYAEEMINCSIKTGDIFFDLNMVGGKIQSETFPF